MNIRLARARQIKKIIAAGCLLIAANAHASLIKDIKIGEALLADHADATELAAIEAVANGVTLVLDYKTAINTAALNPGTSDQWFLDVAPDEPGYFTLVFGTGSTSATADTFFFQNIGELTKLVWSNADVQFLSGGDCKSGNDNACNIGRLSHYAIYNDPVIKVPEPGTLLLLGLGLGALSLRAKKLRPDQKRPTSAWPSQAAALPC